MKQLLISVIIPVYGVEKYIAQCLESVINQTYKNLEIIVVNDGTKDRSAEIAKEYAAKDSRIKVYDFENGGVSIARNRGLEIATGDYISYIDSDDWIDSDYYETLLCYAIKNDVDLVKCGCKKVYEKQVELEEFSYNVLINNHDKRVLNLYDSGFLYTVVWNGIYEKHLAMAIKFPEDIIYEDNYASGMYYFRCKKIGGIAKYNGYNYRINENELNLSGEAKRPFDKILAMIKLKIDIEKEGGTSNRVDERLSITLYHYIKKKHKNYRIKCIEKSLLKYMFLKLNFRRCLSLMLYLKQSKMQY